MPQISVVLPVYNMASYLRDTLDSLMSQRLTDIEIICVNDGSSDDSLSILREYEAKDKRIQVFDQENQGAAIARNVGLDHASGEYLSILDADDIFEPDMLSKAYDKAKETVADIVIFRANAYNVETKETTFRSDAVKKRFLPGDLFSGKDVSDCVFQFCIGWTWDKLFKREFIEKHNLRFQSVRIHNDAFFVFAALLNATKISIMHDVLVTKRTAVKTAISSVSNINLYWRDLFVFLYYLDKYLDDNHVKGLFERSFYNLALHLSVLRYNLLEGESRKEMGKYLRKTFFPKYRFRDKGRDYFYNKKEYDSMLIINSSKVAKVLRHFKKYGLVDTLRIVKSKLFRD